MTYFGKRAIAGFLAVILVASMVLLLPLTALASLSDFDDGTGVYEGGYDINGKRSGYGTWTYHNFLYVGHWENDLPNGEGTLYQSLVPRLGYQQNELYKTYAKGEWVDGYANGAVKYGNYYQEPGGEISTRLSVGVEIPVRFGHPETEFIYPEMDFDIHTDKMLAGVPPFSDVAIDTSLPAPGFLYDDSWTYVDEADKAAKQNQASQEIHDSLNDPQVYGDGTGTYDGEYDLGGKRSGFGTWAYYNYLYVGNWENGMPNGEGTLYFVEECRFEDGHTELREYMLRGCWVDGRADGTVDFTDSWSIYKGDPQITFRIDAVENGVVTRDQMTLGINVRRVTPFGKDYFLGGVEPWARGSVEVHPALGTPWHLYEMYPTGRMEPAPKIENTGMGYPPGNLANHRGLDGMMAALGDWIFFSVPANKDVGAIFKMRPDGSQMVKLYEDKGFYPDMQVIGDWLYLNGLFSGDMPLYKMHADELEFTMESEWNWIDGVVVDDWEYKYSYDYDNQNALMRLNLDNATVEHLGLPGEEFQFHAVAFAEEDWVYIYDYNSIGPQQLSQIKTDGSGVVKRHSIGNSSWDFPQDSGQIVGGRVYYSDINFNRNSAQQINKEGFQRHLLSVDLGFSETPITIINPEKYHNCGVFNVTDDYIYYSDVYDMYGSKESTSIVRIDHDGGNPAVLTKGIKGSVRGILIAGDWMMYSTHNASYLMRLDGSDLHKANEPFVPSNAPGITDSTGKWRYEVLSDGSAKLLGAGSKLKFSGKLAIPATVDKIPVTAIGENAFYGYDAFTSVTIPKSVTEIGDYAFFWCKGLTSATIPEGVAHIGEGAFQYCEKLKKLDLPASLLSVGNESFAHCDILNLSVAKESETFAVVDGALVAK